MITENKHKDNKRNHGGLENDVPQNRGMDQNYQEMVPNKQPNVKFGNPVDSGGVKSTEYEPQLEEQWLAVRDEYLANYPDLQDVDTEYEKGSFNILMDRLAKRKQRSTKEIQNEIMNWPSTNRDKKSL